jgi:hypothetical protein
MKISIIISKFKLMSLADFEAQLEESDRLVPHWKITMCYFIA